MFEIKKGATGSAAEKRCGYSRVTTVDDWVFVANTSGTHYESGYLGETGLEQVKQAFQNVETILASVGATLADVVRANVFIPHVEDRRPCMLYFHDKFKDINPVMTLTCPPLAGENIRFEMELTARRGVAGSSAERFFINIGRFAE